MNSTIDLEFADGKYTFALPVPQIQELQRKCEIGIGGLFSRLLKGCSNRLTEAGTIEVVQAPGYAEFHILDIVETIRHGLIGGGKGKVNDAEVKVSPQMANQLVQRYVLDQPLTGSWSLAVSILGACIMGYDPPKKDGPDLAPATETATAD